VEPEWKKEIGSLQAMIQNLTTEVAELKQHRHPSYQDSAPSFQAGRGRGRGRGGDRDRDRMRGRGRGLTRLTQDYSGMGYDRGPTGVEHHTEGNRPFHVEHWSEDVDSTQQQGWSSDEPVCWRCGQPGHMQYGCRVRLDHTKRPLNYRRPMGRGGP